MASGPVVANYWVRRPLSSFHSADRAAGSALGPPRRVGGALSPRRLPSHNAPMSRAVETSANDPHDILEETIDDVVDSYDGPQEINNLESAALPNKRAVIEAFNHLKPVIYLGFYSTRSLKPDQPPPHRRRAPLPRLRDPRRADLRASALPADRPATAAAARARLGEEVVLRLFAGLPDAARHAQRRRARGLRGRPGGARASRRSSSATRPSQAITAHRIAHVLYAERCR